MKSEIVEWIVEAFADQGRALRRLDVDEAVAITRKLMTEFVQGNPRVWWLALRHPHTAVSSRDRSFKSVSPTLTEPLWFIPETDETQLPVFEMAVNDVDFVRVHCPLFEYYVASQTCDWLVIETDHDQFLTSVRPAASS